MNLKGFLLVATCSVLLFSCVSSKKYKAEQQRYQELTEAHNKLQAALKSCEETGADGAKRRSQLESEIDALNKQIVFLKENNTTVLTQLKDLSVLSSTQPESVK